MALVARGEQTGQELARREHAGREEQVRALAEDPHVSEVRELSLGEAEVGTGRISAARQPGDHGRRGLFSVPQLARIDEALTYASRDTGVDFSVFLGDLGSDTRDTAEAMLSGLGDAARESVLIAVSPGQRVVEVVTGSHVARRVTDRGARLAVMAMVGSFKEGDLVEGLLSGLRMLADQAGHRPA